MVTLGLTGSIGMGKSTAARLFAEEGACVFDFDAAVAELYAPGGAAVSLIAETFPGAAETGIGVNRPVLSAQLQADPGRFETLNAIVHPLVDTLCHAFFQSAQVKGVKVAVLDAPLLFETGRADQLDYVVVVSAPKRVQRARVLARKGMDETKLDTILARQMPDSEKQARADFVIDTSQDMDAVRLQVRAVLDALNSRKG